MLHQIDQYVGMLLDEVDELGIRDNTIFIFTADNGPEALPAGGTNLTVETVYPGTAGPWRGTLFTGFEGGLAGAAIGRRAVPRVAVLVVVVRVLPPGPVLLE